MWIRGFADPLTMLTRIAEATRDAVVAEGEPAEPSLWAERVAAATLALVVPFKAK